MAYTNKIISHPHNGQTIRFLQTARDTGGRLLEMESHYRPGSQEPIAHYHPQQEEEFRVIQGELSVRISGELRKLQAGDRLHIPSHTVHSMWNGSGEEVIVHWKVWPALETEYFLETGMGLAQDGKLTRKGMPPLLQTALLARRYSHVFRIARPPYAVQKLLFGLLAPLARLMGYRAVYKKYLD